MGLKEVRGRKREKKKKRIRSPSNGFLEERKKSQRGSSRYVKRAVNDHGPIMGPPKLISFHLAGDRQTDGQTDRELVVSASYYGTTKVRRLVDWVTGGPCLVSGPTWAEPDYGVGRLSRAGGREETWPGQQPSNQLPGLTVALDLQTCQYRSRHWRYGVL